MPVMEIIRHKTFAVVRKTAKSAKVSCHKRFMVYGMPKLLRFCTEYTIHWKTFVVHHVLYTASDSSGELLRLAEKLRKFNFSIDFT